MNLAIIEGWFKKEVEKTDGTNLSEASKIKDYVDKKVKWNKKNDVFSGNLKDALEKGIGSSSEKNFLLINALKAGGFDAFPVLLRTRKDGLVPLFYPSASSFNYVITGLKIDTIFHYIDAADQFSGWDILPQKELVSQARALRNDIGYWVDLSTVSTGVVLQQGNVKFTEDGTDIYMTETRRGIDAYNARNVIYSFDNQDRFIESVQDRENCIIDSLVITGLDDNNVDLITKCIEKHKLDLSSEFIYYSAPVSKLYKENPFKAETRTYPINFNYLQNYIQTLTIEIPAGYEVVEIPKTERIIIEGGNLSYTYSASVVGSEIKVNVRFQLKALTFLSDDYHGIKEFFAKMILKNDELIVFKKKTGEEETVSLNI